MSDSSDSDSVQTDNSETIQSDNSDSLQSNSSDSETVADNTSSEIIQTSDPKIQFDKQELTDFRIKVKKHIDNLNRLKQLNDGQKDIQTQKRAILNENKELQKDIISFAEDYGINKMTMKNGYVLTFTIQERPKPINEEIIRTGIAEQLKHYKNNETIENIGIDNFINELIGTIDSKRKEGVEAVRSVKFIKPRGNSRKKQVSKKSVNKKPANKKPANNKKKSNKK